MRKFFSVFVCLIYFFFANAGFAFAGDLYFVKNSSKDKIKGPILSILQDKNFTVKKQDPYYAISTKDSNNFVVIILLPSGSNYFYFYESNDGNSVNKKVLKELKNAGIVYEQSYNSQYLTMFEAQAQKVLSNTENKYSFNSNSGSSNTSNNYSFSTGSENGNSTILNSSILAPQVKQNTARMVTSSQTAQNYQTQQNQYQNNSNSLKGSVIQVSKGSSFKAYLQTPINTSTASVGDEVRGVLSNNWTYGGRTIAPQGSVLTGSVKTARHATYGSRNGRVVFSFNKLMTPDGKTYDISTEETDFTVTNDGKLAGAVSEVLVGAAVGALVGLLYGACSRDTSTWKSTAISAGVGAGAAAIKAGAEKGVDAEIPVYTEIDVTLSSTFAIVAGY